MCCFNFSFTICLCSFRHLDFLCATMHCCPVCRRGRVSATPLLTKWVFDTSLSSFIWSAKSTDATSSIPKQKIQILKCLTHADTKDDTVFCPVSLFLFKPFNVCIKEQNPALTLVLTSVIPKLRCIFWYFSEILKEKKKTKKWHFKNSDLLDVLLFFCHSMEITEELSYY